MTEREKRRRLSPVEESHIEYDGPRATASHGVRFGKCHHIWQIKYKDFILVPELGQLLEIDEAELHELNFQLYDN